MLLKQILEKGELQVADRERESQLSNQFRDIATIVMAKTVNPETERPYTITMIERLMREVHFAVDPHRNSKQQVSHELFNRSGLGFSSLRDLGLWDQGCGLWRLQINLL